MCLAVAKNQVKHVLLLSSIGAHLTEGAGVVQGLSDAEIYFRDLNATNVLNLRPAYFMENTLGQVSMIKNMGFMGSPIRGDLKLPMVATADISKTAAKYLGELSFTGNSVKYVLGSRDISYDEIAAILSGVLGKEIKYVTFPYADAIKGMMQMGWSEEISTLMTDLAKAINENLVQDVIIRNAENTTATSYEEFAHIFKAVFDKS